MRSDIDNKEWGKTIRIFEALSGVDEELLTRSEEGAVKVLPLWRYSKVIAACFCLIVVGGLTWGASRVSFQPEKSMDQVMPRSMEEIAEEITADVTDDNGGQSPMSDGNGNAGGTVLSQNKQSETTELETQQEEKEGERSNSEEEIFISSQPMIRSDTEANTEEKAGLESIGSQESQDVITDTQCSIQADTREKIGEKEAYATEGLGAYIPAVLPAGYAFESAYRKQNPDTGEYESVRIAWTKGMDSIFLTVEKAEPSDIVLTDLSKPETYNLYEIPYGETVPREYWEAFDNPVFQAADLSLELIEARMKTVEDSGDTGTPRGDFSVLYENDVLIRFNGDGTAQEIWEMFQSVKP